MKPTTMPNPSQQAMEKFQELDFDFPEAGMPDNVEVPELPDLSVQPTAPTLPTPTLPEHAMAEVDLPTPELPMEPFDFV